MAEERTLKEYAIPSPNESYDAMVYPTVEDNFEIEPALIELVQENQFFGSPTEDPNLHISIFLRLSGTVNANQEVVRLHYFPFSLRGRASAWFNSLKLGSITSWQQMRQTFLAQFFPHSKIVHLRKQIIQFTQKDGESLYNAWERFKEMLRLCPHHGLENWLIIHTFYNGLLYPTKIYVDAAAGGALMNKTYTEAYALIEDMAQNHYQWTYGRDTTNVAPSPSQKEVGMYKNSSLDHLAAKVDALTQKFDKINTSAVTHPPVSPLCEVCGVFGHIGIDCQLGSVVRSPEQVNYAQYNQGFKNNQIFFQTPQNLFGQETTPLSYANNQIVPQKSSLELFLENFLINQSEQLQEFKNQTEFLKDSLAKHTLNVDSIVTHSKMIETQTSQVPQQLATPSQTSEVLLSQTETNPKDHIRAIIFRDGNQLEDPVVKIKNNEREIGSDKPQSEKAIGENDKPFVSPSHEPKIPLTQEFAKSKLDEQFRNFIEILPNKLPPKLKDPERFSIPCVIGYKTFEKAMCDLGEHVSLLPLSLSERLGIG